jgi:hypothetical protein
MSKKRKAPPPLTADRKLMTVLAVFGLAIAAFLVFVTLES